MNTEGPIRFSHRRLTAALTVLIAMTRYSYGDVLGTDASVRPDNSLIVDVRVITAGSAARVAVTYQTDGVESLVSKWTRVERDGTAKVTIGRLRANRIYSYSVRAIDNYGDNAGTATGHFTTGSLPAPLLLNTYSLKGRTTVPLFVVPDNQPGFRGYVGLDLHSPDAPQIVWYYSNPPSNASGVMQVDAVGNILPETNGNFLFSDTGTGPGPLAADLFYREITPDGGLVNESPPDCSVTPPVASANPVGSIWGQGNDMHEILHRGADGVRNTVLHLGKIVKDPFFDAGLAPKGTRLQSGTSIRRWNPAAGTDEIVWDPFQFLNPLTERTDATTADPGINSNTASPFPCAGASLQIEEWTHGNSLQVAPTGVILMSVRHLKTVIAIGPQFDRIAWRIGQFGSDFTFSDPNDKFYFSHFVRMLENGNLLLFDNGSARPAVEGGRYSRALELALDWNSMTATKVWEYRHQIGTSGGSQVYKYADKVGEAQRLANGNTIVWYGADTDPTTLLAKNPQTFTLIEADANPEASALAVMDMQIPGNSPVYRALPVKSLFGEVPGK